MYSSVYGGRTHLVFLMRENSFPISHAICCRGRIRTSVLWTKTISPATRRPDNLNFQTNMSKNLKQKTPNLVLVRGLYLVTFNSILTYTQFRTISRHTRIPAISKLRLADNDHMFINCSHCFYFLIRFLITITKLVKVS